MAAFTRVRAFGLWVPGGALLAPEMELFDAHQEKALNAAEGGVWAPTSVIEIGGQGIKLTGSFWSTGAFRVDGAADLRGGLTVQGADVQISHDLIVQGALNVTGPAALEGGAAVTGSLTASVNITAQGVGTFDSVVCEQFTNNTQATFNGPVSVAGPVTPSGAGRMRVRVVAGADANTTYSVATVDEVIILPGALTGTRLYALDTVGAADGDRFRIVMQNGDHLVQLSAGGGTYNLRNNEVSAYRWLEFTYLSGAWRLSMAPKLGGVTLLVLRAAEQKEPIGLLCFRWFAVRRLQFASLVGERLSSDGIDGGAVFVVLHRPHATRPVLACGPSVPRASGACAAAGGAAVPSRSSAAPASSSADAAGLTGAVAAPLAVADLGALGRRAGAGALDLLPRGADLGWCGVRVVGTGYEGQEQAKGKPGAHGRESRTGWGLEQAQPKVPRCGRWRGGSPQNPSIASLQQSRPSTACFPTLSPRTACPRARGSLPHRQ